MRLRVGLEDTWQTTNENSWLVPLSSAHYSLAVTCWWDTTVFYSGP